MNSYNENLHSSVVSSLNEQELELQKLKSQVDASTFSMYYAQGARITAEEKLETTTDKYKFQQKVNKEAITDSDLSTNVLTSANNVKSYVAKSVTNTAVAAANVQIAANAILKLASDTGSIFSIVNAADFGTDIYTQSKNAYELMNVTAYKAEKTSQDSMEASSAIAEVSATTLVNKATVADTSVKDLLTVVSTQLDAVTVELTTETTNLATTNTAEKKTEGDLEDYNAAYHATQVAYSLANKELNLDLTVFSQDNNEDFIGDETNYTVNFFPMKAPFKGLISPKPTKNTSEQKDGENPVVLKEYNPVENYYIMLAKASKKDTFTISEAEGLVTEDDSNQYIKIPQQEFVEITDPAKITQKIFTSDLSDTDKDSIALGGDYVIFIFAELRTGYKKIINTFDNYLSAASEKFSLTNQLNTPEATSIIVFPNNDDATTSATINQTLTFNIWEDTDYNVAYRCMYLPHTLDLVKGLLTVEGLDAIESETEGLERIADKYNPKIYSTSSKITSSQSEISGIDTQLVEKKKKLRSNKAAQKKTGISDDELKALKAKQTTIETEISALNTSKEKLQTNLSVLKIELNTYTTGKENAITKLEANKTHIQPGFYFDLLTAEQVPAGSYTNADEVTGSSLNKLSQNIIKIIADLKELGYDLKTLGTDIRLLKTIFNTHKGQISSLQDSTKDAADLQAAKDGVKTFLEGVKVFASDETSKLKDGLNVTEEGETIISKIITDLNTLIDDIISFLNTVASIDNIFLLLDDLLILADGFEYILKGYTCTRKQMTIKPETTDNFGNRLINNNTYIPVVLSNSNATSAEENLQFSNALSDFQTTAKFVFKTTNDTDFINFKN